MKKIFTLFLFISLLSFYNEAQAQIQNKFSASLQIGYGTGGYEATHSGIGQGKFAFRIDVSYTIISILDAYISYNRAGFSVDAESTKLLDASPDFTASGLGLGLRLHHGPEANVWIPWLRAGLAYQTLKWEVDGDSYSDSGLGFEIATGIAYPVTEQIKIVPALSYTRYTITGANGFDNAVVVLSALIGARYEF